MTLYGDMVGFAVLADVFKRDVRAVSDINDDGVEVVIPACLLTKAPVVELRQNQV